MRDVATAGYPVVAAINDWPYGTKLQRSMRVPAQLQETVRTAGSRVRAVEAGAEEVQLSREAPPPVVLVVAAGSDLSGRPHAHLGQPPPQQPGHRGEAVGVTAVGLDGDAGEPAEPAHDVVPGEVRRVVEGLAVDPAYRRIGRIEPGRGRDHGGHPSRPEFLGEQERTVTAHGPADDPDPLGARAEP